MKNQNQKYFPRFSIVVGMILLLRTMTGFAQTEEIEYGFQFKTVKNADYSRSLIAELYGELDRDRIPVYEATIHFYNVLDTQKVELGTAMTSNDGIAELTLKPEYEYIKDEEGYMTFVAEFEGSDGIDMQEEERSVMDLNLTMELLEEDGTKSIMTYANVVTASGEEEPLEEGDIYYYVRGMINKLKIEDGWLEYGEYEFEFPDDLPGDKEGNLTIYARIEDSDDFGSVVIAKDAQWGVGPSSTEARTPKLWTELGPEWMIVVLSLLLIGVWANLIHAIYNLVKIKNEKEIA